MGLNDYSICYSDGSYRTVQWWTDEFKQIAKAMKWKWIKRSVVIAGCLYDLKDIRAVIELPPLPEEPETEEEQPQETGAYDFLDFQSKQWLAENMKIDIDKGGIIDEY